MKTSEEKVLFVLGLKENHEMLLKNRIQEYSYETWNCEKCKFYNRDITKGKYCSKCGFLFTQSIVKLQRQKHPSDAYNLSDDEYFFSGYGQDNDNLFIGVLIEKLEHGKSIVIPSITDQDTKKLKQILDHAKILHNPEDIKLYVVWSYVYQEPLRR